MIRKKHFLLFAALAGMTAADAANSYGLPDNIQDGNILHLFDWNISDIRAELPAIAEAGFGAIQLSPMQGNAADNAEWFYAYLPYDMKNNVGRRRVEAHAHRPVPGGRGLRHKVIVDVVANPCQRVVEPPRLEVEQHRLLALHQLQGHQLRRAQLDTHDNLGDYPDLNSEHADVQAAVKPMWKNLKAAGVKGIRWDAAKHIGLPSEGCALEHRNLRAGPVALRRASRQPRRRRERPSCRNI